MEKCGRLVWLGLNDLTLMPDRCEPVVRKCAWSCESTCIFLASGVSSTTNNDDYYISNLILFKTFHSYHYPIKYDLQEKITFLLIRFYWFLPRSFKSIASCNTILIFCQCHFNYYIWSCYGASFTSSNCKILRWNSLKNKKIIKV